MTLLDLALSVKDFEWLDELRKLISSDTELTFDEVMTKLNNSDKEIFYIENFNVKVLMDTERFAKLLEIPIYRETLVAKYNNGMIKFFRE